MAEPIRPVSEWPRLLAGPMVRRVTSDRAHFFLATSVAAEIEIELYSGRVAHSTAVPIANSGPVALDRIGERLWVGVVSVSLPASSAAGAVKSYDIFLRDEGTEFNLFTLGLLGGSEEDVGSEHDVRRAAYPLGYSEGMLPSFVTPVDDLENVQIVHGSCRKPHGGKDTEADALQLLDADLAVLLGPTGQSVDVSERPQQLILTGDQIYADDVPAGLLAACSEAARKLLDWDEELPVANGILAPLAKPGWRTRLLSMHEIKLKRISDKVEDDYSANHLLRFGEWCAMYLFAWSDALWAVDSAGEYSLPDEQSLIPIAEINQVLGMADTIGLVAVPARVARAGEIAEWLNKFADDTAKVWEETRKKALAYAASTCSARRALANVATYTMFDDHEITDDWYLNRRVHDRLKGVGSSGERAEVGPRLLRNGLSAYAIFQHWGNEPSDFEPDRQGRQLLDLWEWTGGDSPSTLASDGHTRDADALLDITPANATIPASGKREDFDRIRWDYAVGFPSHRLIVLDTRTWRHFPPGGPITWSSLGPLAGKIPGDAMSSGGSQLEDLADAWRQAGTVAGDAVVTSFADVVDAYVDVVRDVEASEAVLRTRLVTLVTSLTTLIQSLPSRAAITAAERRGIWGFLHQALDDPAVVSQLVDDAATTRGELVELVIRGTREAVSTDFGPGSYQLTLVMDALAGFVEAAFIESPTAMAVSARDAAKESADGLWQVLTSLPTSHPAHAQLLVTLQGVLGVLDDLTEATGFDEVARAIFRDGSSRLGAGLIRKEALPWMVNTPLEEVVPTAELTLLLSPAPIFGNALVETLQRIAVAKLVLQGKAGEEEMDFEAWSANVPAMCNLFEAASSLRCAVVLSGDVHYGGSSVNDVTLIQPPSTDVAGPQAIRTRYVQLTSSSTRNSDFKTRLVAHADDILYDDAGESLFQQSDWTSLLEHGSTTFSHLQQLQRARREATIEKFTQIDEEITRAYEKFRSTSIDWSELAERAAMAPVNSVRAWGLEAGWKLTAAGRTLLDFMDDPLLAVYGDFLTAGQPTRQLIRDLYRELGIDQSLGLKIEQTVLLDRRSPRLSRYPAAGRYATGTERFKQIDVQERRTVGHANLGFVRMITREDEVVEVHHEMRWYPKDEPASNTSPREAAPRQDWLGTLHQAGWYGLSPDVTRSQP